MPQSRLGSKFFGKLLGFIAVVTIKSGILSPVAPTVTISVYLDLFNFLPSLLAVAKLAGFTVADLQTYAVVALEVQQPAWTIVEVFWELKPLFLQFVA